MSLGARRTLVAVILSLVVLAVIGLLYLQAIAQGGATRPAWMVTRNVTAGAAFDTSNVRQVRIPGSGDQFSILTTSPIDKHAARSLNAQTLLRPDDVLSQEVAQVPVTLRTTPQLAQGDVVDVYANVNGRTISVGRRLVVVSAGNPVVLLVPAQDEQAWITLQAGNVSLFAARSPGVSVGDSGTGSVTDAIQQLTGNTVSGPIDLNPPPSPTPAPRPTPRPTR